MKSPQDTGTKLSCLLQPEMDLRNRKGHHAVGSTLCQRCGVNMRISMQHSMDWTCSSCVDLVNNLPFTNEERLDVLEEQVTTLKADTPKILPTGPKFLHINVNGLRSRYTDLQGLLVSESNVIACGICETKLKPDDSSGHYIVPRFQFYRKDRIGKEGGGVGIYVNMSFTAEELEYKQDTCSLEVLIVKIYKQCFKPVIFITIYFTQTVSMKVHLMHCKILCHK